MLEKPSTLDDIAQIHECSVSTANKYLDAGYRLLRISEHAKASQMPSQSNGAPGQSYVQKYPVYVIGRPRSVKAVDIHAKQPNYGAG